MACSPAAIVIVGIIRPLITPSLPSTQREGPQETYQKSTNMCPPSHAPSSRAPPPFALPPGPPRRGGRAAPLWRAARAPSRSRGACPRAAALGTPVGGGRVAPRAARHACRRAHSAPLGRGALRVRCHCRPRACDLPCSSSARHPPLTGSGPIRQDDHGSLSRVPRAARAGPWLRVRPGPCHANSSRLRRAARQAACSPPLAEAAARLMRRTDASPATASKQPRRIQPPSPRRSPPPARRPAHTAPLPPLCPRNHPPTAHPNHTIHTTKPPNLASPPSPHHHHPPQPNTLHPPFPSPLTIPPSTLSPHPPHILPSPTPPTPPPPPLSHTPPHPTPPLGGERPNATQEVGQKPEP